MRRWDEAAADYKAVLAVAPDDPSAWNNLGNTNMGAQTTAVAAVSTAAAGMPACKAVFGAAS
jgi:Flp pilus assembly protein TadD